MSASRESGQTRNTIPAPSSDESQLTDLSVQEKQMQIQNMQRQQDLQALLQQTATQPGGIFDQAAGASFTAGASDIDNATQQSLVQLRQELAPSLGLRSTDSPVLDRGGLVERQGILAKSSLANSLRSQALTNRLALLTSVGGTGLGLANTGSDNSALGILGGIRLGQKTTNSGSTTLGLSVGDLGKGLSGAGDLLAAL